MHLWIIITINLLSYFVFKSHLILLRFVIGKINLVLHIYKG